MEWQKGVRQRGIFLICIVASARQELFEEALNLALI